MMFDPRRMTPTQYPRPSMPMAPRRRPVGPGPQASLPAYGAQSWYPRGRFSKMKGVSTPFGYTRDGGQLTPKPSRQTQLPIGAMGLGGTASAEWGFRKGVREARTAADTQLSRYYARRGLTGGGQEAAGMRDVYTKFGQMLAEGLAGIRERYQNQMMSQFSQYLASRGARKSGVSVHRAGYKERQEKAEAEKRARLAAWEKHLTEQYYKEFGGGG